MTDNSMQKAREALARHPKCGAHCRTTGNPCRNAAMKNGRCRMHGGKSPGAPEGERNGNYRHGMRTKQAENDRMRSRSILMALEQLRRITRQ